MTPYVVFRIIVFLLLGAVWYNLDRAYCTRLYRWWYGMTHEHPLPPGTERGFIYGQATRARALAALLLSTLISVIAFGTAHANSLAELLIWASGIPILVIGFFLGPNVYELWRRKEKVFDAVDKVERGDVDLSDELKDRSVRLGDRVKAAFARLRERLRPSPPPARLEQKEKPPDAIPEDQAREMMEKFIRDRTDHDGR